VSDTSRSFLPGGWYAVLSDRVTVLLPASERARVARLWEVVDDGAGFDDVLDHLVAGGLRTLPAFVLVGLAGGRVQVVVRGDVTATFTSGGEQVEVDGAAATTWAERVLTQVSAMDVVLEDAPEGAAAGRLAAGLARVSRITFPASDPAAPAHDVAGLAHRGGTDLGPPTEAMVVPTADAAPDGDLHDQAPADEVPADEGAPPESPDELPDASPDGSPADDETGEPSDDDTAGNPVPGFGTPVATPDAGAGATGWPEPDTADSPAAADDGHRDHDGLTRAGSWEPEPFAAPPGIPGQPQAPSVTARPVARLVMSHGETVDVDRAILVGRAPEARRFPSSEQPRLVTVPSPQQEISSTHLEIRPGSGADHGSAVVTDLGSTNGTVVVQPGLAPEDLQAGIAVQLIPGAVIDLGDGLTIQVVNP
jgi:hypothetical protein